MSRDFAAALQRLAALSDDGCEQPWRWLEREGGKPMQARGALYRSLEDELAAAAALEPTPVAARGAHELWTATPELARLDAAHAGRAAEVHQ